LEINRTKEKLKRKEKVFGCFVRYPDPALVEMVASMGWDFVVLESEHGSLDLRTCENMVRSAKRWGVTPIVRVTTNSQSIISRFLETGAQGIIIPQVNSQEEAKRAVQSVEQSSKALTNCYDAKGTINPLVVLYIETIKAVSELTKILEVEGIDVINVGRTDLSQSLGFPGQTDHPEIQKTLDTILTSIYQSNIGLGIMASGIQAAQHWKSRGACYITVNLENLLKYSIKDYLDVVRG
jgi:4-hydroxy-2-oxoheptanedioate aldolase